MQNMTERLIFSIILISSLCLGLVIFYRPELHVLRNHVGDIVATLAVYCCLALFFKRISLVFSLTLVITIGIEFYQTLPLANNESELAQLLLGQTFDLIDLMIYGSTSIAIASVHLYARKTSLKNQT